MNGQLQNPADLVGRRVPTPPRYRAGFSALAAFALALAAFAADVPRAWLTLSSTNLTVTETATAVIHIQLPPLKEPYDQEPPILNQRPPHVEASFLEQEWKPAAITPGSMSQFGQGIPRRGQNVRVFTLNKYVSNDIFSSMRDPFSFFNDDPFESLGPKPQRFPFLGVRDDKGNWHFTIPVPQFTAKSPGKARFEPVSIEVPAIDSVDSRGRVRLKTIHLRTNPMDVVVASPPEEGRPASWCGAIGRTLSAVAALDANICTAGDPLVFSLEITGEFAPDTLLPPDVARLMKSPAFRIDAASVKTETKPNGKRFTWRVRAVQAGTLEFPSIPVALYNVEKRTYATVSTEAIPIQVKAGAQAALGALDEEDETFPSPDGLDLDFPLSGNVDFTLRRAFSLATRAAKPAEFAAAAAAYADYLSDPARPAAPKDVEARHLGNLAALRYMAGDWRGALSDYAAAERAVGETPSTLRGIRASWARIKNDPRAELPLQRILLPFWYKYSMPVRIAIACGIVAALALLFFAAVKTGSRFAVLVLALGLASRADAQFFNLNFGAKAGTDIKGQMALEPKDVVVGEPCAFVVELDVAKDVGIEQLKVSGLPDPSGGTIVYGESFEPLVDGKPPAANRVLRRFRLSARFLVPHSSVVEAMVSGMAVTRRSTRFGSSSFANSFNVRLKPLTLDVKPLPEAGRPKDFSGAVGRGFRLRETFTPDHVRPGDLVKVNYTLVYDGYLPPDAEPKIGDWGNGFKVWDLKEKSRRQGEVVWEQMIAPQNTSATNGAFASVEYYDLAARRYSVARAIRPKLVFVSSEKASTQNTAVTVAGEGEKPADGGAVRAETALNVRFAPSDASPVLFKLPTGAAYEELAKSGAWRRVSTVRGIGWIKAAAPKNEN